MKKLLTSAVIIAAGLVISTMSLSDTLTITNNTTGIISSHPGIPIPANGHIGPLKFNFFSIFIKAGQDTKITFSDPQKKEIADVTVNMSTDFKSIKIESFNLANKDYNIQINNQDASKTPIDTPMNDLDVTINNTKK